MVTAPSGAPFVIHTIPGSLATLHLIEYKPNSVENPSNKPRLLLLDGGCRCDVDMLEDYIKTNLGADLSALDTIIVTHAHPDHQGGAADLRQRSGASVIAPSTLNNWYAGRGGQLQRAMDAVLGTWAMLVPRTKLAILYGLMIPFVFLFPSIASRLGPRLWHHDKLPIDTPLPLSSDPHCPAQLPTPGAVVGTVAGFDGWSLIAAPGHTTHMVLPYHAPTGTLYVADAFTRIRRRHHPPLPVHLPGHYAATMRSMGALDVRRILYAHSGIADVTPTEWMDLCDGVRRQAVAMAGPSSGVLQPPYLHLRFAVVFGSIPADDWVAASKSDAERVLFDREIVANRGRGGAPL